jgi:hypothetical protein
MLKFLAIAVLALSCVSLTGCNKDAVATKFIADLDSTTQALVQEIAKSPNPAGTDAAQKALDAKKDDLRKQYVALIDGKASPEMFEKTSASIKTNVATVVGLWDKYRLEASNDPKMRDKLQKLSDDYLAMLKTQ